MIPRERNTNPLLVTAALPYANGKIHLGHVAGAYLPADIYVRYNRSQKRDVLFICGSDEHGVPITITADQEKTSPQAIVDRYHNLNKKAFEQLGISFDNYSRTTLPLHHKTAQEFFLEFHSRGIVQEKREQQLFDEKAGMFLPDRYVEGTCPVCGNEEARGDQCEQCGTFLSPMELVNPKSKITGTVPTVRETSHWYFPLGKFQKELEKYIAASNRKERWKDNVLQYCNSWFKEGLKDRAVTRDLAWGVKVPLKGYEAKVLYVWFEAVLGYVSSTKEWAANVGQPDRWKKYWLNPKTKYVAFIGKDNVVFHCIVFPAIVMAWNRTHKERYVLPANVPANEFLNFEGQKFSKSRNWGIDVDDFLSRFPPDALRYALAVNLPEIRDTDFYWKDFQARNNNELADILGNFINRTLTFVHKHFEGIVPPRGTLTKSDKELIAMLRSSPERIGSLFDRYSFREGTTEIMNVARFANKYFNDSEPWKTLNSDRKRCATTLHLCLQTVCALAILCEPVLPFSARRIWAMLGFTGTPSDAGWERAGASEFRKGHPLGTPEILFAKVEDATIEREVTTLMAPESERTTNVISIDDFRKIELRVAKVVSCEKVAKSQKLLKLQVSFGTQQRQIIAGIAQHYTPENLVGRNVVVVANLQPARIMGEESQGMLLAASDNDGKLSVVTVDASIAEGSIVK